jgi:hypothetical protein
MKLDKQHAGATSLACQTLVAATASTHAASSIQWARGHFLSRRFPDLRDDEFLDGYGGKLSSLTPVLDFMNHNLCKKDACTAETSSDGLHAVLLVDLLSSLVCFC